MNWRLIVAVFATAFSALAAAQDYPARAIRLIVPFAPGGPNDIAARIVAEELSKALGQSVIAENRPGAGGNVGAEAAARSPADGYTLFWAQAATHGINPSLYRKLGYDVLKDFTSIALIGSEPLVLVANSAIPATDVKSLIAAAKAQPGKIHFGSGGSGTTPHMAGELFAMQAGVKLVHVPYKGNAPAVADAIGGHVQLVFDGVNSSLGHIRAGRLKALAVTSRERAAVLPDVPTVAETLPDYEVLSWNGIAAPASTPTARVERLSAALMELGSLPAVQGRFAEMGMHLQVSNPDLMDRFVRTQIERWRGVLDQTGTRLD
jgi:tripartite-type tricarboxylate transporter receptor subunit TctC